MRSATKKLLIYGAGAAAVYYFFVRRPAPAPAATAAVPATAPGTAGFGYFPSGTDRPFARIYNGAPSAWYRTHNW